MSRSLIQSSVLYRDLGRAYPTIVRGEGVYLWDAEGRRYIDGSGGSSAVTSIGHGVQEIADAMAAQARKVAFVPIAPLHERAPRGPGRGRGQVRPR